MPEYRTDNMALAAYLTHCGHSHQRLVKEGRKIFWVFTMLGNLAACVEKFLQGDVAINPEGYVQEYMDLRRDMFAFMDAQAG